MIELFWGCLIAGLLFAVISLVAGGFFGHGVGGLDHAFHFHGVDFLNPTTIFAAVMAFGGAGVLLVRYTSLSDTMTVAIAIAAALGLSSVVHVLYVRPMRRSESSLGFAEADLIGMTGRVTIPIPSTGYGEVMITIGGGNTCQVAASHDAREIPGGTVVVILEIREHALFVSPFDEH